MDVYLNAAATARRLGLRPYQRTLPRHDVEIGRYRGWNPGRVKGTHIGPGRRTMLVLLSAKEIAVRLQLSAARVNALTEQDTFPQPVACIGDPETLHQGKAWRGAAYGWAPGDIDRWARETGRMNDDGTPVKRGHTGRPKGSGDYLGLPRCGRPRVESLRGNGRPCKAVRRKFGPFWSPACALHLTVDEEDFYSQAEQGYIMMALAGITITDDYVQAALQRHKEQSPYTAPES